MAEIQVHTIQLLAKVFQFPTHYGILIINTLEQAQKQFFKHYYSEKWWQAYPFLKEKLLQLLCFITEAIQNQWEFVLLSTYSYAKHSIRLHYHITQYRNPSPKDEASGSVTCQHIRYTHLKYLLRVF